MMRINGQQQTALLPITFMERLRSKNLMRGQATIMAFATLLFLVLMTLATYNISQMTHGKMQTMNAADAGAYAAAIVAARDANFMAYTNRAMVANHVVVGQLVSLASLSMMLKDMADTIGTILRILRLIPYVGPILGAIGDALKKVADALEKVPEVLDYVVVGENMIISGLSKMQPLVRGITLLDMQKNVEAVIKANDPELQWAATDGVGGLATTAKNVQAFLNHSERQKSDAALGDFRDVVRESRDGFTRDRPWGFSDWFGSGTVFNGGTDLSSDNKTWVGLDAFKITYPYWSRGRLRYRTVYPFYGGEVAGSEGADDYRSLKYGQIGRGRDPAYNSRDKTFASSYDGLQPYQELNNLKQEEAASDPFVIMVYKPIDNDGTPNANKTFQTGGGADNFYRLEEKRKNLYGVAASQVYFRRPALIDNDKTAGKLPNEIYRNGTYATLFSPYWQARLTNLPAEMAGILTAVDK
ncbi:hypothetical protein FACS1894185_3650 [Betaproteobacteria bacterium]|nr:hypothetical protein FACS1894185_3650 [Betaproteobacteria bacterium]GHU15059.1 hypothetical protein FACS189441_6160 [Betaproteobacteria bacterium]